ncbi:MAG: NADH-quinone oxidoreductase subunit C [Deltaproteobacteria bacterium]|nr:NADH-quinone oxidoreductase subunit C [Deltaproteobacteria bacterium]
MNVTRPGSPIVAGLASFFPILEIRDFQQRIRDWISHGGRVVSFFGSPAVNASDVNLNVVLANETNGSLLFLRSSRGRNDSYHSLAIEHPQFQCFERECFEQFGVKPKGHPWLKPIRYPSSSPARPDSYPFYLLEGKEIHEVGVGPIHAGVIEPGHFRFMCYGETVHHLEIQLGYQHRGAEALLLQKNPACLAPLIETIAGDSSIAHTWAYCMAYEALCGVNVSWEIEVVRGIALELERVAMHLAGLAGMSSDIAFLPGGATYGRLRTTVINTSMRLCGSRFGRGWLRPGEVRFELTPETLKEFGDALRLLETDLKPINDMFQSSKTVQHRLKKTGRILKRTALEMGFVGMVARSSGIPLDLRARFPGELYRRVPISKSVEESGDCWARAMLRIREIGISLKWLTSALAVLGKFPNSSMDENRLNSPWKIQLEPARAASVAIAVVESWRGEVMHCLQTDSSGKISHYKVQDPSIRNWFAVALAVRNNDISDFPICNKSFDLSYCGQDL